MQLKSVTAWSLVFHLSSSCPFHVSDLATSTNNLIRRSVPAPFSKTAITNVNVFDGSCFLPAQTIVIEKDQISHNTTDIATTINGTGLFLVPGLIDSHIHIFNVGDLEIAASYGVTTSMNMACENFPACNALKGHTGLSDFKTSGIPAISPNTAHAKIISSYLVTNQSSGEKLVEWTKGNGSDYFKIVLEDNGPSYNLTRQLVSAAHEKGLQTMGHASELEAYKQASETGIHGIQHIPRNGNLTDAVVHRIKANGQHVTPTLSIFAAALNPPNPAFAQFLGIGNDFSNNSWANIVHNARALYRANVPILAGTDAFGTLAPNLTLPIGEMLHRELELLVDDVGMSPAEAINSATIVAAKYHGMNDRGVIQAGMRADLLLLGSNPLENVRNTRDIVSVWVGGRKYQHEIAQIN